MKSGIMGMLLLGSGLALADSLEGHTTFVCSAGEVTVCTPDGICDRAIPQELQIPQFLVVDLAKRQLATTRSSGQNRATAISHQARENGHIVVQGTQAGRAFSMTIKETTGLASMAISLEGLAIGVFGACTPLPVK